MPNPLCRDDLLTHIPRLIARADQRRRADNLPPRPDLVPETLATDTIALAESLLVGAEPPPGGLNVWLDARLELMMTERWNEALLDYTRVMTARARVELVRYPLLSSRLSAEDIVGEVWCKVLQFPFRGAKETDYYQWLCGLVTTAVVDAARRHLVAKKRSARAEVAQSASPDSPDPFDHAVRVLYQSTPSGKMRQEEFRIKLLAAVEQLAELDRTVAVRTLNGESPKEIAEALEVNVQWVNGAITRILGRVRDLLIDRPGGA